MIQFMEKSQEKKKADYNPHANSQLYNKACFCSSLYKDPAKSAPIKILF